MIEARVGDGTYVRALTELAAPLVRRVKRGSLKDAIEVRAALEKEAAHLAALRRTKKEVSRLRQCLAAQKAAIVGGDRASYTEADAELHRIVVACARNQLLTEIYEHLGGALKPSFEPDSSGTRRSPPRRSITTWRWSMRSRLPIQPRPKPQPPR